jgi:hypothetical protein
LLGRGVEGVGLTKNVVELQKLLGEEYVDIYATIDKTWGRAESMNFKWQPFRGADWTQGKPSRKFPDLISTSDVLNRINTTDLCLVFSVPSQDHPEPCIDNFLRLIKEIKVPKSLIQVDHLIQSIRRNARLKEICQELDVLLCHSTENPFAGWVKDNKITTPLCSMGVGFNFTKDAWLPVEEQIPRTIRWVGRAAGWKGPELMIDLHNKYFQPAGYITMLEGLEANISYKSILNRIPEDDTTRRDVVNFFRYEKERHPPDQPRDPVYGDEQRNMGAYLYPPYKYAEMIQRMNKTTFGSDLMHFKTNIYGNNIEYCHTDSFAGGAIPLFHKHFCDNVIHRKQGLPINQCKNTGTLSIDMSTASETLKTMELLSTDLGMRREWREQMYEFWSEHCDAAVVYADIIDKTLNPPKRQESVFSTLFS